MATTSGAAELPPATMAADTGNSTSADTSSAGTSSADTSNTDISSANGAALSGATGNSTGGSQVEAAAATMPSGDNATMRLASTSPTVSVSSTYSTFSASRAIDGDINTEWQAVGSSSPWLQLDLQANSTISALAIKAKPGQTFDVKVSADGTTFKTLLTTATSSWNLTTLNLPAGTTGRYLRVAYHWASGNVMVFEAQPKYAAIATPTPSVAPSTAPTSQPTAAPSTAPTPAPNTAPSSVPVSGTVATRFGNQSVPRSSDGTLTRGYQLLSELGMNTIREGWNWKNIETGDQQYVSWMSYFDTKASTLAGMGEKTQAMVCDTPSWASSNGTQYGVPNGLSASIFADGTDVYKPGVSVNRANKFASYMYDMVTRYKGKIAYWQVWNEPDFPSGDLGTGTTGSNGATRYWDGSVQQYVRLLKVAYTLVHGIDPAAKVTLGGLGYESYLGAIIDNGGAPYFDVVDFHAYGTDKTTSNGVLNTAWGFLGRYNALKGMLKTKGVTGKTFSCSETGFTANNQPEQANYVAKVFATGLAQGDVEMVQWAVFTNPGFNNIGIIDSSTLSVKTQGYSAYSVATAQLKGCTPTGALTGTGVQGYTFRRPDGKSLAVAWSTSTSASLALPFQASSALNVQGKALATPGSTVSLSTSPIYVIGQ